MNFLLHRNLPPQRIYWLLSGLTVTALAIALLWYVVAAANPVIRSDNWYYTGTLVDAYVNGHLGITDLLAKRGPGDNAQPLNRLILIGLVKWFHMDLNVQGIFGALVALAGLGLLCWFALREVPPPGQPSWQRPLLVVMLAAVFLSLNAAGDYNWPQVTTLVYTGTLGICIYFYFAATLSNRGAWLRLAAVSFVLLMLFDTFATLAVLASTLLILVRIPGSSRKRQLFFTALAGIVTLLLYQRLYAWLTGMANTPLQAGSLRTAADYLLQHAGQTWKLLVAPFGAALYAPPLWLHDSWPALTVLAVPMWFLNIWFWWRLSRSRDDRIAFLAGGLMLYSYATVAGMLVDRIPHYGFDYLLEPRYVAFYQLQLMAILLLWSRAAAPNPVPAYFPRTLAAACLVLLALDIYVAELAWRELPYQLKYQQTMVAQINALALDPTVLPPGCLPETLLCRRPLDQRRHLLDILESHQLNVFSADVRRAHGYAWRDIPPPRGP